MKSFLGLVGYYRRFTEEFSKISSLLKACTHKNIKFEWRDGCENSFQELKEWLVRTPILIIPEGEEDFVIYCDVSGQVLGTIFMQYGRVIAYASQ